MSNPKPPASRFNGYFLRDGYVLYKTAKGDALVTTGLVWITEPVKCPETGNMSYLLEVQPFSGERTTLRVRPEDMNAKHLKKILGQTGLVIHEENKLAHYLSMTASFGDFMRKTPRTLIESPGWFAEGRGFYTGRSAITAKGIDTAQYRFEPVNRAPVAERGSLAAWQENIGVLAQMNPILLTIMCVFIASPFLKSMRQGSRLVNIFGAKGTGKTLCSQVGATIFGNGVDPASGLYSVDLPFVTKFSTTINGIEPLLARYSPLPIALDELTEQTTEMLGALMYKVASGEGKHRLKANLEAATVNRWLLTIIATSEKAVADAATRGGKPLLGGQQDRAIDIPIDHIGVITDFGGFDDFQSVTRHLKMACGEYYGTAGRAILQYACDNPEQIETLIATSLDIEERLLPTSCGDGERRVVKFLTAAVVAGHIAIKAGVLNCTPETVENAVRQVVAEWWRERGGALRRIAEFLHANVSDVELGPMKRGVSATAFIDGNLVIIPDDVFEDEFGDDVPAMLAELLSVNALVREGNNGKRNKCRFCNNSRFAYVIKLDRLEPIMHELVDGDDSDSDRKSDGGASLLDE